VLQWKFPAVLLVALWLGSSACAGDAGRSRASENPESALRGEADLTQRDDSLLPPKGDDIAPTNGEPGGTYCCGNHSYKLEIECGEQHMRCYEYRAGSWHYTYGRHCKKNLGLACYLNGCDDKC
jgi:hypothetical protein